MKELRTGQEYQELARSVYPRKIWSSQGYYLRYAITTGLEDKVEPKPTIQQLQTWAGYAFCERERLSQSKRGDQMRKMLQPVLLDKWRSLLNSKNSAAWRAIYHWSQQPAYSLSTIRSDLGSMLSWYMRLNDPSIPRINLSLFFDLSLQTGLPFNLELGDDHWNDRNIMHIVGNMTYTQVRVHLQRLVPYWNSMKNSDLGVWGSQYRVRMDPTKILKDLAYSCAPDLHFQLGAPPDMPNEVLHDYILDHPLLVSDQTVQEEYLQELQFQSQYPAPKKTKKRKKR